MNSKIPLTNEKIEELLKGIPKGKKVATHVYLGGSRLEYWKVDCHSSDVYGYYPHEGEYQWFDSDFEPTLHDTLDLSLLREILSLRKEVEQLRGKLSFAVSELNEAAGIIDERTNLHSLAETLRITASELEDEVK